MKMVKKSKKAYLKQENSMANPYLGMKMEKEKQVLNIKMEN